MSEARRMIRTAYKSVAYRFFDVCEAIYARATRRTWYTPGASAAEQWIKAMAVSGASSGMLGGQPIVSLVVQNDVVLSGPAERVHWNSIPARVDRMKRIVQRTGLHSRVELSSAHYALLDNVVNRYIAEFCAYPYQSLRTMNLLPGDVFLDIGAFRGYVSVKAARKVGEFGRVYAVEPVEENFRFVEHHRDVNGLANITAFRAAVTPDHEADSVEFFRTENQGNACIQDHLKGDARTIQVENLGAGGLLRRIRTEMPDAKRIVCSLTTNGTEMTVAEALMDAFEAADAEACMEITIPVIFTMRKAEAFAERVASRGWCSEFHFPWLRLWRSAGAL